MRLHNDQPVILDRLLRRELVQRIGTLAATGDPPLVFGIHGDWGLGKTSILHQICHYLAGECLDKTITGRLTEEERNTLPPSYGEREGIAVVWFEAWRYQNEAVPVVALLQEMRHQLAWYHQAAGGARKILEVAIRGALLSLEDSTKKIGFQASKIEQAGRDWEAEHLAVPLSSNVIREQLSAAIDALIPTQGPPERKRVVVIIDDLDRCEPEAAFKLLEGMKLYLTLPNCVFILGMNQQIIEDAIAKHVPGSDANLRKERAGAYLEKLCHNIWRVPAVQDPREYLLGLLPEGVYRDWVRMAMSGENGEDLRCLPPNPRRLKGLANLLIRLDGANTALGQPSEQEVQGTRLQLIVALVYQFHHDLYRHWESYPELYEQIRNWCRGELRPFDSAMQASIVKEGNVDYIEKQLGSAQPLDTLFAGLKPTVRVRKNEAGVEADYLQEPGFPDPADPTIFWAHSLILYAEETAKLNQRPSLTGNDFRPYLQPQPRQN